MSWYFLYNQLPASERGLDRVAPALTALAALLTSSLQSCDRDR